MITSGICTSGLKGQPTLKEVELNVGDNEICLPLEYAALNHRDIWITKGLYPGIVTDKIMGADGMGNLDGKRYVIYPAKKWGNHEAYQSNDFEVLGIPSHGTFAKHVICNNTDLVEVPSYLSDEEAAAFPLAALTAYRALFTKANINAGDKILVTGIGGGVALFVAQFALAYDAQVYFTSGHDWKIERALELGLTYGVNYNDVDWVEKLAAKAGSFQIIIDSAGGSMMENYLKLIDAGGKIVIFGGTLGRMDNLLPGSIFWKQASILGTTMGSPREFSQMIDFMEVHKIKPVIDSIYKFEDFENAFKRMGEGSQFGKILLKI